MTRVFTRDEAWTGGSYDLGLELGPRDDSRLRGAMAALWSHPDLEGCYLVPDVEPQAQQRIEPIEAPLDRVLHGVASIGDMLPIAARTVPVRFDSGADWIYFTDRLHRWRIQERFLLRIHAVRGELSLTTGSVGWDVTCSTRSHSSLVWWDGMAATYVTPAPFMSAGYRRNVGSATWYRRPLASNGMRRTAGHPFALAARKELRASNHGFLEP